MRSKELHAVASTQTLLYRRRGEALEPREATVCVKDDACDDMFFFFQAEDGIRDVAVTGVQTCALPISRPSPFLAFPRSAKWGRVSRRFLYGFLRAQCHGFLLVPGETGQRDRKFSRFWNRDRKSVV